jgi:hypothetical protein
MFTYNKVINLRTNEVREDVILRSDGAWIPADNSNTDYQTYLKWVAEGNIAEEITNGN